MMLPGVLLRMNIISSYLGLVRATPDFCILNGDGVHTAWIELKKSVTALTLPRSNPLLGNSSHHFTGYESMNLSILVFVSASTACSSMLPFAVNV